MRRTNKEGQKDKSDNGTDNEKQMAKRFQRWLEGAKIEDRYHVQHFTKGFKEIAVILPGGTMTWHPKPDCAIVDDNGEIVVFGGAKTSFRERLPQDAFAWEHIRDKFPKAIWVEQTICENDDEDTATTARNLIRKNAQFFGYFGGGIYSIRDPASLEQTRKIVIAHLLRNMPTKEFILS